MTDSEFRGATFVRSAIALSLAGGKTAQAHDLACDRWGRSSGAAMVLRAAVAGGSSDSGDWSGLVDAEAAVAEFLDLVGPRTILGRLDGLRSVPANTPFVRTTGGASAYWVGEGRATPVSPMAFERAIMVPLKLAALVVFSEELLRSTSPKAEGLIRRDLVRAVAELTDASFIDPANAGAAGQVPASVTHEATSIAGTGDLEDDLANAIDAFAGDFSTAAWAMHPRLAVQLAVRSGGTGPGSELGLRGGTLLGLPAFVSTATPYSSDGGVIALLDAGNIIVVDEGARLRTSREGTVEMATNPTGDTTAPTLMGPYMLSLFQEDSIGLVIVRRVNWAANDGSVVAIVGAEYGGS